MLNIWYNLKKYIKGDSMYSYIKGAVKEINPKNIVIENNGIGYEIVVSNPYEYLLDDTVVVYLSQQIREDSNTLYGFFSKAQKNLFLMLLKVKGVGPKSALAILAGDSSEDIIKAIESSNVAYLTKFPGVGKKSAQQIILDLQGKLNIDDKNISNHNVNEALEDALLALEALGYTKKDLVKLKKNLANYHYLKADEYVKQGLKLLMTM